MIMLKESNIIIVIGGMQFFTTIYWEGCQFLSSKNKPLGPCMMETMCGLNLHYDRINYINIKKIDNFCQPWVSKEFLLNLTFGDKMLP